MIVYQRWLSLQTPNYGDYYQQSHALNKLVGADITYSEVAQNSFDSIEEIFIIFRRVPKILKCFVQTSCSIPILKLHPIHH